MEFIKIVKDIAGGNLPVSEIPGFLVYLVGRSFWVWFALIVGIVAGVIACNL